MPLLTPLTDNEIRGFCQHYPIAEIQHISPILSGVTNTNYKITCSNSAYIFRVCNAEGGHATANKIKQLSTYLASHAIPTPQCIAPDNEQNYQGLPLLVFEYIHGAEPERNDKTYQELAQLLRKLHSIPVPDWLTKKLPVGIALLEDVSPKISDQNLQHDFTWAKQKLEHYAHETPRIIHADLYLENSYRDRHGKLWLLDWDCACAGPPLFDVGMSILGCLTIADGDPAARIITFLQQYKHYNYEEAVEAAAVAAMCITAWRYRQFEIQQTDSSRLATYQNAWAESKILRALLA